MPQLRFDLGHSSIRFQLLRLVVVVSTVALVISMVGGALLEWHKQQQQVRQTLVSTAQAAGIAASAAVAFHDGKAATEALRILAAQKDIEAAAIFPLAGDRLASYGDLAGLPDNIDGLHPHLPSIDLFSASTTLFQPIELDDTAIGYIFMRTSLLDYRQTALLQAFLVIAANLLALLLAIGLSLRFINRIVEPVKELAKTSQQVRDYKNFALRATPPDVHSTPDEIGALVVSFNTMLAEIEQRDGELARYHDSLERMVQERTAELHAANLELQLAKEAAEASMLVKSRFLAAASHDLRQPVQAINLFKDALIQTALNAEQKRISQFMSRAIENLGELLDALLDISKLDAGAIRLMPEAIEAHELFSSIEAEFATLAAAQSLRFKLHFPLSGMALFTDGKLLQSLLRNLIGNAIKYTRRGGVLVAMRRRGDQAIIQIWDTGIGIAPEHLETIFDEYFQVANPERDKAKGLGLGLAIVKRLAKLLGTEIVCHSRVGHGSVFEFSLPLAAKQPR